MGNCVLLHLIMGIHIYFNDKNKVRQKSYMNMEKISKNEIDLLSAAISRIVSTEVLEKDMGLSQIRVKFPIIREHIQKNKH